MARTALLTGRRNRILKTCTAVCGVSSDSRRLCSDRACPCISCSRRACNPRKGLLCDGSASTSSGTLDLIEASDSSQSVSGSASGPVGKTDTFDVISGSTWSPEISRRSCAPDLIRSNFQTYIRTTYVTLNDGAGIRPHSGARVGPIRAPAGACLAEGDCMSSVEPILAMRGRGSLRVRLPPNVLRPPQ